jgi:hypothetical protein
MKYAILVPAETTKTINKVIKVSGWRDLLDYYLSYRPICKLWKYVCYSVLETFQSTLRVPPLSNFVNWPPETPNVWLQDLSPDWMGPFPCSQPKVFKSCLLPKRFENSRRYTWTSPSPLQTWRRKRQVHQDIKCRPETDGVSPPTKLKVVLIKWLGRWAVTFI